jgi:hypothetical protein
VHIQLFLEIIRLIEQLDVTTFVDLLNPLQPAPTRQDMGRVRHSKNPLGFGFMVSQPMGYGLTRWVVKK